MAVPLLLDTNVLLHYARGKATGTWLRERYDLRDTSGHLLTCRVVIAEVLAFVAKAEATGSPWGKAKQSTLTAILDAMHIIEITDPAMASTYAELVVFSEVTTKPARAMIGNDLWIAAAAKIAGATLLTADPDFDHLHGHQITVEKYDPRVLPPGSP
jgi:predicted nucleic acid-binding protein